MTTYRARNTLTGQTFLPRATMCHAMQDYIMQPVLSLWTVDLLQTPDESKSFDSVFPEATESPRGDQGERAEACASDPLTDEQIAVMCSEMAERDEEQQRAAQEVEDRDLRLARVHSLPIGQPHEL